MEHRIIYTAPQTAHAYTLQLTAYNNSLVTKQAFHNLKDEPPLNSNMGDSLESEIN